MQLSLRTRLTAWYALLLVLTLTLFSSAVLWLHWRLLIEQVDGGIESIASTSLNVLAEELGELNDLPRAIEEMRAVVHPSGYAIDVIERAARGPAAARSATLETLAGPENREWRVATHATEWKGRRVEVVIKAPLDEARREWRALLKACLIGLPIAVIFAVAGGLWVGRRGLAPLSRMTADALTVTASTPGARLTAPAHTTELAQLAASFNQVLDRLGEGLATQRRFMADASHELRTPISIARTAADVTLGKERRDESEYREALTVVAQQATRLTRLVDDMLVLARADGGGYPVKSAPVDLAAIVGESVREVHALAEMKRITLRTDVQAVVIAGDEGLLRRMLSNLLGNALTYTPSGGAVGVSLHATPERTVLRVRDTGPGIPAVDRERVFERFVRLDPARSAGGTGLGLAIARWIAEVHGGRLGIASSDASGSVFEATFPPG